MNKRQQILETALRLFSEKGFYSTSTASIAKEAGVSEGLIFKHFGNKNGLLESILALGITKGEKLFQEIYRFNSPEDQLRAILSIPMKIPEKDFPFWKLVYALKWQAAEYDQSMYLQIKRQVIEIFHKMEYSRPELEAEFVLMVFDGIATSILLKGVEQKEELLSIVFEKYQLAPANKKS